MIDTVQAGGKHYVKTAMKLHRETEFGYQQAEMLVGLQVLVPVVHAGLFNCGLQTCCILLAETPSQSP